MRQWVMKEKSSLPDTSGYLSNESLGQKDGYPLSQHYLTPSSLQRWPTTYVTALSDETYSLFPLPMRKKKKPRDISNSRLALSMIVSVALYLS